VQEKEKDFDQTNREKVGAAKATPLSFQIKTIGSLGFFSTRKYYGRSKHGGKQTKWPYKHHL
jgi:hypothetical protein